MTILIPVLAAVLGLVVYLAAKDKVADVGRLLFFAGALVSLLVLAHETVGWLGR